MGYLRSADCYRSKKSTVLVISAPRMNGAVSVLLAVGEAGDGGGEVGCSERRGLDYHGAGGGGGEAVLVGHDVVDGVGRGGRGVEDDVAHGKSLPLRYAFEY